MTANASQRPIKIMLTCSGLEHVRRGVETWSQQAFLGLRARGADVTLFKGSGSADNGAVRVVRCVKRDSRLSNSLVRFLPRSSWRMGLGSAYQLEQTTFALNLFGASVNHFDILHTKDPQVALIFQRARRMGLVRPKVILNHGTEEPPEFLKHFDYIQHLAPFHKEEAEQQGVRARRHFAIPNFVDTAVFQPGPGDDLRQRLRIPEDAFVVLSVAAIKRHHKRMDWLIQEAAAARKQAPSLHLLVVGSRTAETEAIIKLGRKELGSHVSFLVDEPHSTMPSVYRASDLFVLCSLKEMLANVYLEAMSSGVPCIGSNFPVSRWVIGDGGETVSMRDSGVLAAAILKYGHPASRRQAGERARRHAVKHFSSGVVLGQQVRMYQDVMSDTP